MASVTIFASLKSLPGLENANLSAQSPQFYGGKTGAQEEQWLGQGHTAKDGEMERDPCLRPPDWWTPSFSLLHTPHCSTSKLQPKPDSVGTSLAESRGGEECSPSKREKSLESSPPKDIKQKGRLDQKAEAMPKCHRCHKLSSQTCQTRYNYPAC